jgi:hypothetical protein
MKTVKLLSASMLISAILLSSAACAQPETTSPDPSTSVTSQPASEETNVSESDIENVLTTVNGYYNFISQPDSFENVRTAGAELTGRAATDEELQKFASTFSEGFQYFDTSTSNHIKKAYNAMMVGSNAGYEREGIELVAPADGVTIDGESATFNTTWISVTEKGEKYPTDPETDPSPSDMINLVKEDNGTWVIVAKDSPQVTSP